MLDIAVTEQESNLVLRILERADPQNAGVVTGDAAVAIFQSTDLSPQTLKEIWDIADCGNRGYLDERGVAAAVRLMGWAQSSKKVDKALVHTPGPLPVLRGLSVPEKPRMLIPPLKLEDARRYYRTFEECNPSDGVLPSERAREAFRSTEVAHHDLDYLWTLADYHQRDFLDAADFALGMHLINLLLSGQIQSLPPTISAQTQRQIALCVGQANVTPNPPFPMPQLLIPTQSTSNFPLTPRPSPSIPLRKPPIPPKQILKPLNRQRSISGPKSGPSNAFLVNDGKKLASLPSPPTSPTSSPSRPTLDVKLNGQSVEAGTGADALGEANVEEQRVAGNYFRKLDKKHVGYLESDAALGFMRYSKLPEDDLAHIWELADQDQDDCLTLEEFTMAIHLIAKRLGGLDLPPVSPISSIDDFKGRISRHNTLPHSIGDPVSQKALGKLPADLLIVPVNAKHLQRSVSDMNLGPTKPPRPISMANTGAINDDGGESVRVLRVQNNQLSQEVERLRQSYKDLSSQLNNERSLHQKSSSQVVALKSQLHDLEQSMSHVLTRTAESNTTNVELLREIERLVGVSSTEAGEMEQLRLQLEDAVRGIDETRRENNVLRMRVEELDTGLLLGNEEREELRRDSMILKETNELLKMRLKEMETALAYEPSKSSGSGSGSAQANGPGTASSSGATNGNIPPVAGRSTLRGKILKGDRTSKFIANNNVPTIAPIDELPGNARTMALLMGDITRENEMLKARLRILEDNMAGMLESHSAEERKLKEQIMHLTRDMRSTTSKMHSLEADNARMILKIDKDVADLQNMRIENERLKTQLREATRRNGESEQQQIQLHQRQAGRITELERNLERLRIRNRELEEQARRRPARQASINQEDMSVPPPAYDDHAFIPVES